MPPLRIARHIGPLGEMAVAVLHHDNCGIDQHTHGQRQAAKRHNVGADVQKVHGDERGQHGDGQRQDGNQRRTEVEEKGNADEAYNDCLEEEVPLERVNRLVDEPGAVIAGHNFNAGRQRGRNLLELGLHSIDDIERIHAVAHNDNAADGFPLPLPVSRAPPHIRTERDCAQILYQNGRAVLCCNRDIFEIGERAQIAEAANHVFRAIHVQHVSANFIGALPDSVDHGGSGDAVGEEFFGIEIDLILAHKAADAGHFRDTGHGFKLVAQVPVLQSAQVGQALGVAAIHDGVLVNPTRACGIRADCGMNVFGQPACDLAEILRHARPRPIEVGAILEDDENIGVAEHRLGAHVLDIGS